ncbi:MAG: hypothetical protein D6679_10220 [Candidatus Hydrogenedentota bacterium]|nr:MAG: hypothetical protein D6679_10220 [Candidatus Hydrogenedentota bacterium]
MNGFKKIISIQQPEAFPWLGFFDKIRQVDEVVLLDSVQFKKRYFENRNRVRTANGWTWITVPVITKGRYHQKIRDVEIDNTRPWRKKILGTLEKNYRRGPGWKRFSEKITEIIVKNHQRLVDLNLEVITFLLKALSLERPTIRSSDLDLSSSGSRLILDICKARKATTYLSGAFGRNYLDLSSFSKAGIEVRFQEFRHPIYRQIHKPFLPGMSALDLIFSDPEHIPNLWKTTEQG